MQNYLEWISRARIDISNMYKAVGGADKHEGVAVIDAFFVFPPAWIAVFLAAIVGRSLQVFPVVLYLVLAYSSVSYAKNKFPVNDSMDNSKDSILVKKWIYVYVVFNAIGWVSAVIMLNIK